MRKITITVAAFLAATAMSATEVTSSGLELTIASGKNTTSTEITLPAGSYVIDKGSNSSLTVTVSTDGGKTAVTPETDGTFKVVPSKETTYTITVTTGDRKNVDKETSTTVKVTPDAEGLKAIKDQYTTQVAAFYTKANSYSNDSTLQALALQASELVNTINNYGIEEYIEYQKTGKVAGIEESITNIGNQISAAQANYTQYQAALSAYSELEAALNDLKATYDSKVEEADGKVDMSEHTKTYEVARDFVTAFKRAAVDAYEAGTAADVFSSSNITSRKKEVEDAIAGAKAAIQSGTTNDLSYANVNTMIANAKSSYNTVAAEIYNHLLNNPSYTDEGDLYTDTYTSAQTKLNKSLTAINEVAKSNETDYRDRKADSTTQAKYKTQLEGIIFDMTQVKETTIAEVDAWRSYYAAANMDIADSIQSRLDEVSEKISTKKYDVAYKYFKSSIASIQSDIDTLQAKVDAQNKAHTLTSTTENFGVSGYTEARKAVIDAVDKVVPLVGNAVNEINADDNSKIDINSVNTTYTNAKKAVNDAADTTYNYIVDKTVVFNAGGKFTGLETAIEDSLNKFAVERSAAYEKSIADFNNSPKHSQDFYTKLGDRLTKVGNSIDVYTDTVVEAREYYKNVYDAIVKDKAALSALQDSVTNVDVTVTGNVGGENDKSYATAIAEYESKIAAIQKSLDDAYNNNSDATLVAALKAVCEGFDTEIKSELDTLATNYKNNKGEWERNVLKQTQESMLNQANTLVDNAEKGLPASYDDATYGLKHSELNDILGAIKVDLISIKADIGTAQNAEASTENIALLSQVNAELKTIQTRVSNLQKAAETAKTEYAAETTAYNALIGKIREMGVLLYGGTYNNVSYISVADINKGIDANNKTGNASQRRNFTDQVAKLADEINIVKRQIETSRTNETVRKDEQTVTDEKTKVTTYGYDDKLAGLKQVVEKLRGYAQNEANNDKDQIAFTAEKTKAVISAAIEAAKADVNTVTSGTAATYFLGLLDGYTNDYDTIEIDQTTYYEKNVVEDKFEVCGMEVTYSNLTDTGKNMAANHAGLTSRLNTLAANIEAVKTNAKANDEAQKTLKKNQDAVQANWDKIFQTVSTAPTSSYHETAINTLNAAQKDLNAFTATLKDEFGKGTCGTNQSKLQIKLDSINTTIGILSDSWASDYDAAISEDNAKRYETFNAVYKDLADTYKHRIGLVTELSKTSVATQLSDELKKLVGEAGIYTYANKISTLKSNADSAYNETVATANVPDLYDVDELYTAAANTYKREIKEKADRYITAVNDKAKKIFIAEHAKALLSYNKAVEEIQAKTFATEKEAKDALADVWSILEKSAGAQNQESFATIYEQTYKAQLASIEDMIAADKEAVAVSVWADRLGSATELSESEKSDIQTFSDKSGASVNYVSSYNDLLSVSINKAAEEWNKIADGEKYDGFKTAYENSLYKFIRTEVTQGKVTHTRIYWNAKKAFYDYNANDEAYNTMVSLVADAQKVLDEAQEFVSNLIVVREMDSEIEMYQSSIDILTANAVNYHESNTSEANLDAFKTTNADLVKCIQKYETGVKARAFEKETGRIGVELVQLQLDYENAIAHSENMTEEINKYKSIIDGYFTENNTIYSNYTEKKEGVTAETTKAAFLALEKKIGVTKNELNEIYQAGASVKAQAAMQAVIDSLSDVQSALVAQLADCHDAVKEKHGITVEGMGADIAEVQDELNTAVADGTVLLYQDLITTNTELIASNYVGLSDSIAIDEEPYIANDEAYAKLTAALNSDLQKLQTVYEKTADYYDNGNNFRDTKYAELKNSIKDEQNRIDKLNATGTGLNSESTVTSFASAISDYEEYLSYQDNMLAIVGPSESSLTNLVAAVQDKIDGNLYTANYLDSLKAEKAMLDDAKSFISDYVISSFWKKIKLTDLDGNKLYDEYGNEGVSTTATVEHDAIKARIAEIRVRIEALDKAADKIVGDADGNGEIGINDYTYIINIILENSVVTSPEPGTTAFDLADANCDGKIDVADAVAVVNALLGNTSSAKVRRAPAYDFGSSLSLTGEGSGYTQRLNISLKNGITFTGGQFDLVLPEGMTIAGASLGSRASGMELRYARLANGATRVLISSAENNDIEGSEGDVVSIDVNVSTGYDGSPVEISNAVFSDAKGRAYYVGVEGEATGINTVTTAEYVKGKIYSVGGQLLDGLRKGVNIIRNADGTSQKVIVK